MRLSAEAARRRQYVRACRHLASVALAAAAGRIEPAVAVAEIHAAYLDVFAVVNASELRVTA